MRRLISLGAACDVGFQLRMHGPENVAHFFDWLSISAEGVVKIIEKDFDVFHPDDLTLIERNPRYVQCIRTGAKFHHQFPHTSNGVIRDYLVFYRDFIGKFEHLAARFRDYAANKPVTFVRRNITKDVAERLEDVTSALFPGGDLRFFYMTDRPFETRLGRAVVAPPRAGGLGNMRDWAELLLKEGLISQPYNAPTEKIITIGGDFGLASSHTLDDVETASNHRPDDAAFLAELARAQEAAGKFDEALVTLDRIAAIRGGADGDAELNKSRVLVQLGRADKDEFAAAAVRSGQPAALLVAARIYLKARKVDDCIRICARLLRLHPTNHRAAFLKAQAHQLKGEHQEAINAATLAIQSKTGVASYHHVRLKSLTALHREEEAAADSAAIEALTQANLRRARRMQRIADKASALQQQAAE